MEAGVDSLGAVELRNQLQRLAGPGVKLSSTLMFDFPTVRQVVSHLQGSRSASAGSARAARVQPKSETAIKVSGMSAALPRGVSSLDSLQQMSHCGHNLLTQIPLARWDLQEALLGVQGLASEVAGRVRHGAFLNDAHLFQHTFFGISALEAIAMDPQQRLLLEKAYLAFHNAGLTKADLLGSGIASNVGQWESEFTNILVNTPAGLSVYAATGSQCSVTCGRVSFVLGLHGPCSSMNTACSSSLVAHHSSFRALQSNECEGAMSAGSNMVLHAESMR
eukprot:7369233-Prymnesium_polylepis.1